MASPVAAQPASRTVAIRAETSSPLNVRPTFDNGYLVVYEGEGFSVFAPDGSHAFRVARPSGTAWSNVAVDSDGTAASALRQGIHNGIWVFDQSGARKRYIDTGAFIPGQVCFAPDHSIWTTGAMPRKSLGTVPEYSVLRHFSGEGEPLGEFLPRSSFEKSDIEPATAFGGGWGLRVANGRIGAFFHFGDRRYAVWVEVGLDGREIGRWPVNIGGHPAAFTQSGDVYASTESGVFQLDRKSRQWKPVASLGDGLLGAKDDSLVFLSRGDTVLRYIDLPH
jgi:hypothetical protein